MKTGILTAIVFWALWAWAVLASQDRLTLTTPVYVQAGVSTFRVYSLFLQRAIGADPARSSGRITATLLETDGGGGFVPGGKTLECVYNGDQAEALIVGLNRADLSNNSLERRVIVRCQTDGQIGPGAVQP